MDPNLNLDQQLEVARAIVTDDSLADESDPTEHNPDAYAEHVRATELAEHVVALHEWITNGGFLPAQWRKDTDRDELTIYLDRWMDDYGRPMHGTTLECLVDGVIEHEGSARSLADWRARHQ